MDHGSSDTLRNALRQYGLPQPEDVPREEVARMWKTARQIIALFLGGDKRDGWTEDSRRELGRIIYEPFVKGRDRIESTVLLTHFWATIECNQNNLPRNLWTVVAPLGIRGYCIDMARWFEAGFPKAVIDSKYAAILMATRLSADVIEDAIPPWEDFIIELPKSILAYRTKQGERVTVDHVFVSSFVFGGERVWDITLLAGTWEVYKMGGLRAADLVEREGKAIDRLEELAEDTLNEADVKDPRTRDSILAGFSPEEMREHLITNARLAISVRRLVLGACLAMSDPTNVRESKAVRRGSAFKPKGQRGLPLVRTFAIGRPVTIDCREAISRFIFGDSDSIQTVQTLVRGHWKRQAHGQELSKRKMIHVEPYWRGPEDAPILVRPHLVKGSP